MVTVKKQAIIDRLIRNAAEVITEEELRERLNSGEPLTHYIGFEISGYVHLGTGIMSALVMKELTDLGVKCTIWLADWHTWINEKLDGKKETAQRIGQGYFAEAMKASFIAVGGNPDDLDIRLASEWYAKDPMRFWELVIGVSKHTTLSRMLRSIDILGRESGKEVDHAKTLYPAMQVADIFYQNIDVVHSGMDQRKAHVVMRDVANQVQPDKPKPIVIHHPLLMGLQKPSTWPVPNVSDRDFVLEMKMSKSKPDSAIWIHDTPEEIDRKIMKAFCPEKEIEYNPVLNWAQHILFWNREKPLKLERKAEHGGDIEIRDALHLEAAYENGRLHPLDLKAMVAQELIKLLAPVREHFAKPDVAAKKEDLDKILQAKQ